MRLDDARLCLDCEEIHKDQECPACGSEAFAFLTRWIQPSNTERPASTTPPTPVTSSRRQQDQLDAWRRIVDGPQETGAGGRKIVTRSLLGLAAMGLAGWAWTQTRPGGTDDGE
jgi:hypothetical protein